MIIYDLDTGMSDMWVLTWEKGKYEIQDSPHKWIGTAVQQDYIFLSLVTPNNFVCELNELSERTLYFPFKINGARIELVK